MKMLTNQQCAEWLAQRGLVQAPYETSRHKMVGEQYSLPKAFCHVSSFVCSLIADVHPFDKALLHFTDWALYQPYEMAVITTLRSAHGQPGRLIDSPGHLFAANERDLLAGMMSLGICYGWSAYLYLDSGITFLNWEGDILDLFYLENQPIQGVHEVLAAHELAPILPH